MTAHGLAFEESELLLLPVAAACRRGVGQLRDVERLAVEALHLAGEGSLEGVHRDLVAHGAGALAVEHGLGNDAGVAFGIQQLDAGEELQVLAVDVEDLAELDGLARLLGEAGNDGVADLQRNLGDRLVARGADGERAAVGRDAGRGGDADHLVADELEAGFGDGDAAREHDLGHVREAGAVDGHRLAGDHLGGEEHLDVQPQIGRFAAAFLVTGREGADKDHRQDQSEIFEYLLHILNPYCLSFHHPGFWARLAFFFSSDIGMG